MVIGKLFWCNQLQKVSKIKYQRRDYFTHRISKARQWLSRYLWISKARMFLGVRKIGLVVTMVGGLGYFMSWFWWVS